MLYARLCQRMIYASIIILRVCTVGGFISISLLYFIDLAVAYIGYIA